MAINFRRLEDITRALKPLNQTGKSFHTTFVYKGPKLLSVGINNYSKSHKHIKYGEYKSTRGGNKNYKPCLHSEIDALLKLKSESVADLIWINIRIMNNDKLGISKPCKNCYRVLNEQIGFKKFWFYDGAGYSHM